MKEAIGVEFGWSGSELTANFSYLSTAVYIGAAAGSLSGSFLSKYGRRVMNLCLHGLFVLGGLVCAFSNGFAMLLIGRLLAGLGVGLTTVASPMIISEISPLEIRGANGVRHQLFITVGILLGMALGAPFNFESFFIPTNIYMRLMLGLPAAVSLLTLSVILFWKKSDTPNYLVSVGKKAEAQKLLRAIYKKQDIETEYRSLLAVESSPGSKSMGIFSALKDKWYRSAIIVGVVLSIGQQASGINAFVSLSNSIFQSAGITGSNLSLANVVMGVVNCLMTFPAIWIVDSFGRKSLYVMGVGGMTVSLSLVPLAIISPWASCLPTVSVISVVGFIVFFAVSAGPVLWVVLNEIFPPEISGAACGVCAALNWVTGICVVQLVALFEDAKYTNTIFTSFAGASAIVFVFLIFFFKESKGRSNADSPYLEGRPCADSLALNAKGSVDRYV
eukprot:CAMPEP_0113844252 /NCGR_PEP_ID=MMETSP0372-20130328/144_1 /TAXON_ID=340204 /ORGANISM="Lankesteria abbotti" /LENGTH=445 /DNA_ID=CAMNT_0000813255 /DNA_START=143 /DNA_END=1480 /DNA_ORIENTATION=- /assembly_acc=CAM_ASM_000359